MYTLVVVIIFLIVLVALGSLYSVFKAKIHFAITGLDSGFSISDLLLLWKAAELCELDQPTSLFFSINALTKCMTQIQGMKNLEDVNPDKIELIMSKLFDYRTKIQNETDEKKGLDDTRSLDKGQKLRIILPGKGVFVSEIVNNGNNLVINVPKQNNLIPIPGEEWVGKVLSIYLWRKGDARYVFDTTVTQHGLFLGKSALFLKHSANLIRTQKRKSVRAKCEIYGNLFIIRNPSVDITAIETQNGYKCLIEDISESGALIRIGGKGVENVKIKLQFSIQNKLIIMVGVIRSVEFNEQENQSMIHFECTHIDPTMRNEVLSFVYNMLPESEKEILEALAQTDTDSDEDPNNLTNSESSGIESNIVDTDSLTSKDDKKDIKTESSNDISNKDSSNASPNDEILPDMEELEDNDIDDSQINIFNEL